MDLNESGVGLAWIWVESGMDLEWIWGGSGMDLGWIWGGSGRPGSGPVRDPVLVRFGANSSYYGARAWIPGSRAVTPCGHILDPFLTSIRTL